MLIIHKFFLSGLSEDWLLSTRFGLSIGLLMGLWACDTATHYKQTEQPSHATEIKAKKKFPKEGLVRYKRADSSLLSEINYVNGLKHGLAVGYYRNGKIHTEVTYEQGVKHGTAKINYENGRLFRETTYEYGVVHGWQKLYRFSGKLMAEIPYHQSYVGKGLKEYNLQGALSTIYPDLVIEGFDSTHSNNTYILKIYFEGQSDKVEFYSGQLKEGEYLHQNLESLPINSGVAILTYYINPGTEVSTKINVIGVHQTWLKNRRVVEKSFRLSANNR